MAAMLKAGLISVCLSLFVTPAIAKTTTFTVDNMMFKRSATINIPDKVLEERIQAPVVFAFHGPGSSGSGMKHKTDLLDLAEKEGMIVVFPNGTKREGYSGLYWNTSPFLVEGKYSVETDEEFVIDILRRLEAQGVVDHGKVFATGFSMGGMMAYKLGCEMSEVFSAIAVVGGAMTTADCEPKLPVSVLHLHGLADDRVPYLGGEAIPGSGVVWPDALEEIRKWETRQSCGPQQTFLDGDHAYCSLSRCSGEAEVSMCMVYGAGHEWMGRKVTLAEKRKFGDPKEDRYKATGKILDFFKRIPGRKVPIVP